MRNVYILFLIAFLSESVAASVAYLFPLTRSLGGNENMVLWLQLEFIVLVSLLQLPTGRFADRVSYKASIFIGITMSMIAASIYAAGTSLFAFFVAEGIWAVGCSFVGGADVSLLKASLRGTAYSDKFMTIRGYLGAFRVMARIGFFCLGGFLADVSLAAPFVLATVFLGIASLLTLSMDNLSEELGNQAGRRTTWQICRQYMNPHSFIGQVIYAQAVIMSGTYIGFWLSTPWLEHLNLSPPVIGLCLGGLAAVTATANTLAARLKVKSGSFRPYWSLAGLLIGGFALVSLNMFWIGLFGLALQKVAFGFTEVIVDKQLLDEAEEHERATVLSIASMVRTVLMGSSLILAIQMRSHLQIGDRFAAFAMVMAGMLIIAVTTQLLSVRLFAKQRA